MTGGPPLHSWSPNGIGTALTHWRNKHGIDPDDLAAAIGVTRQTLLDWEKGGRETMGDNKDRLIATVHLVDIAVTHELSKNAGQVTDAVAAALLRKFRRDIDTALAHLERGDATLVEDDGTVISTLPALKI